MTNQGKTRWVRCAAGALLLVAVCAASFGVERGRKWVKADGRFPITDMQVTGVRFLYEGEVLEMAEVQRGTNLFAVDTDAVRERLERSGWVREARVRRRLPGRLVLDVEERLPWLLATGEEPEFVDREGNRFPALGKEERLDLPVLVDRSGGGSDVVARLASAFPPGSDWIGERAAQVEIDGDGAVTIVEAGRGTVIRLGHVDFEQRAARLSSVMRRWEKKGELFREIDLRYGDQAIARRKVARAGREGRS